MMTEGSGRTTQPVSRRTVMEAGLATAATMALPLPRANAQSAALPALTVTSPNGKIVASLSPGGTKGRFPVWSASYEGRSVVAESRLALVLADGGLIGPGSRFIDYLITQKRGRWIPPYGIAASYDESIDHLEMQMEDRKRHIRFSIVIAAHDDGVALRYVVKDAKGAKLSLGGEATQIRLPPGTRLWSSRDEGEYAVSDAAHLNPVPHPELTKSSDIGPLADTPITALTPDGLALSISESDRLHYPRLMFAPGEDPDSITTHLMRFPGRATGYSGPGDTHAAPIFSVETPFETPWRVVTIATEPAKLLEKSGLIATLATPNRLGDVSWIKPGRAFRIRKPYTTDRALACVDFAQKRKLEYVEFDAHWYGDGTDASDATIPIASLDMLRILAYAKARGIGMILYVDRVPAMRQLQAIVTTYRQWGVAGIKFGFVWEGRQEDVDLIYQMVRACGEQQLLVNLHDNLRPAGLERTLPNYIALEGVRGNEQFPTAGHNVTLPFTRALSGPIDYTICYDHYKNQTTNAHQLAMAAVYYNPLTFLYWYDEPSKYSGGAWPELGWLDTCPTSWDETRALSGAIGEHIVVARRKGRQWFIGAMTNEQGRDLAMPLTFLGEGTWNAQIHADGTPATEPRKTPVEMRRQSVTSATIFSLRLAPAGGQAILFSPA